jgi:phosphoribosylanthranilate isomerase
MNTKNIFLSFATLMMLLFTAFNSEAQNTKQISNSTSDAKIEVIQFHSEHRCKTCNKIESLTRETLKAYPNIPFSLVNVDDKKKMKRKPNSLKQQAQLCSCTTPKQARKKI